MTLTLQTLYQQIRERLQPICSSPQQASAEADWLLEELLGIGPEQVLITGDHPIGDTEAMKVESFLYQRIEKRIPIQYLLHQAWFFGHAFYVNPHVLIPRPETELLVEQALAVLRPDMSAVDIGTGSGAIAVSLSKALGPAVEIAATDVSAEALMVARLNNKKIGGTVQFLPPGDLFTPLQDERFDVIVSNPPYIDTNLKPTLTPEVLDHEPAQALFAPEDDPCYFYRRLAQEGKTHLKPGGMLMVEAGAGMTPDISQLFAAAGYQNIRVIRDYAGLDRIVTGALAGNR